MTNIPETAVFSWRGGAQSGLLYMRTLDAEFVIRETQKEWLTPLPFGVCFKADQGCLADPHQTEINLKRKRLQGRGKRTRFWKPESRWIYWNSHHRPKSCILGEQCRHDVPEGGPKSVPGLPTTQEYIRHHRRRDPEMGITVKP